MSYEQTLKAVDDILRTDAGCATPIDYIEQTSWILFLKYLSDLESERSDEATLKGKEYTPLFTDEFKWDNWAVPKNDDGSQDIVNALTGDDLLEFVNLKLMPYLKTFKTDIENSNTLEYKIGEIFSEISNKLQSGYTLRDVLNNIDTLHFLSIEEKHEMSHLYEEKIKDMGNAGRSGGEYYTPRPLIQAIVEKVNPKIGETVYDPAVGSAGFLVEAFKHMSKGKLSVEDVETLQFKTFYGKEKKSLAYIIALMNMILHGVDAPNILHINTLTENVLDVQDSERHDVILANPPFGGKERKEVQQNFPIKSSETAYLFMQHFIKLLKAGGRAGVVIKNTLIKDNVIICDNSSIGTTGFGFDFKKRGSLNLIPQIGIVIIDKNVHIGSSCTIDRGKIETTYIGKNSMIDNMVHIAHNVQVGQDACIAAQTGISGSVNIDNNVTIGGQAGISGHLKIGNNIKIGGGSGVIKDIQDNSRVMGYPAKDLKEFIKENK